MADAITTGRHRYKATLDADGKAVYVCRKCGKTVKSGLQPVQQGCKGKTGG
ncbi:MAG: hypothetical protein OXC11_02345 [Rhodospirillales bacterium]|nr:hypothetical protein [Rhodospirillales bacterium]